MIIFVLDKIFSYFELRKYRFIWNITVENKTVLQTSLSSGIYIWWQINVFRVLKNYSWIKNYVLILWIQHLTNSIVCKFQVAVKVWNTCIEAEVVTWLIKIYNIKAVKFPTVEGDSHWRVSYQPGWLLYHITTTHNYSAKLEFG